jgi:hypothetical protein
MKKPVSTFIICISLLLGGLFSQAVFAQPHLTESLLLHLDLDLDKSAFSSSRVQVKIHATDRISDSYFASPVDSLESDTVEWDQDLPLSIDSNIPMRLIFHLNSTDGAPLPSGFIVQWQYDLDGSGFQNMNSNSVTIPADSSGDMGLTVSGAVVAQ